jgi:eukaryotic-like serine/threonine-protein kinase
MNYLQHILREYGLRIDYPITWEKVTTNLPKPLVIGFRRPLEANQDPFLESVGIAVIPIPPAGESYSSVQILEYYTEKDITGLRAKLSDFELIESEPTMLKSKPAHRFVYIERKTKNLVISFVRWDTVLNVCYRSKPETYEKYLPVAERMISSIEFMEDS